jgi:DNA transformation protein
MSAFIEYVMEQLEALGSVRAKKMFGGLGLFSDDLMFAIVVDNTLYLKVDAESRPEYESMALEPFAYQRNQKLVTLRSFYAAPADSLDDTELLCRWATRAIEAAASQRRGSRS